MTAPLESAGTVAAPALRDEVLRGLRATPKTLPPKLFYDAEGARLFECICELDEYYVTRAELQILRAHGFRMAAAASAGAEPASSHPSSSCACRGPNGIENANVTPGPSFGTAQSRPRWFSMIERLTKSPMPMPSCLVE